MDAETLALRPRAYLNPVRQLMQEPKLRRAVVLLGPRRVGKTILIRHLIADLLAQAVPAQRIEVRLNLCIRVGAASCARLKTG